MKVRRIIYIFIFFIVSLFSVYFFSINKIFSNAQNFDKNLNNDTLNINSLETDYEIKTIKKEETNLFYIINYPIFKNNEINNTIHNNIEEMINDFRNEFKDYNKNSENNKVSLILEADVGFFKEDLLFIRFFINRNYLEYPNPITFYKTYIFNLKTGKEIPINEIFNDYSQFLFEKSTDYFKNNYGIKIDLNSENYLDIEPKMENYQNIFIKNDFFEFIIFDYKKAEDIILRINLDEISPFIKEIKTESTSLFTEYNTDNSTNKIEETKMIKAVSLTEPETEQTTEILQNSEIMVDLSSISFKVVYDELFKDSLLNLKNYYEEFKKKEAEKQLEENRLIDPNKPMIALTFDDGPNNKVTSRILDILEKNNSRATFFVVGRRLDVDAEVLKRMTEMGNQIGNHTYNHKDLTKLSVEQITSEINSINEKLEKYTGKGADIIRVPYGAVNKNVLEYVKQPIILWNIDTEDWKTKNSNSTIEEIRKKAKDGDIILMHDLYETTADACEIIIPELINKGFQLVTIDEMMKYKNIELKAGNKYYNGIKK